MVSARFCAINFMLQVFLYIPLTIKNHPYTITRIHVAAEVRALQGLAYFFALSLMFFQLVFYHEVLLKQC